MKKLYSLYVRVSTNKQDAENQLIPLREYVRKVGGEVYKEYVDIISGKEKSRPDYDQMFKDASKRLFDVVLFWDLSRFSRAGTLFTLQKLKELESHNVEWESYMEQYLRSTGEFKPVVISIMATLAKIERQKISERTKAGLQRAVKEGKTLGRPAISGYHRREIVKLMKQYKSINKVAKELRVSYGTCYKIVKDKCPELIDGKGRGRKK